MLKLIVFLFLNEQVLSVESKTECGYKQCPVIREGALNVHLIAHSHMDAGWVKNFDEYYYGTKTSLSSANVQLIYHSVLSELLYDKKRRFTFSETAYFWRWWKEQRPVTRSTFRSLVQEGRIEFAGGGWVQNDEATVDYLQIIDQFTWGLRKLNDTLGPCGRPKAAWQIDTYGHTREQASLLAQMGYDGTFIGRVNYKEKETMMEEDRMEFMWRGSDVLGKMSDIMTHTLFNLYNAPDGFCFDLLCNDEPIVDDPDSHVYNADKRVNEFISQLERQAKYYEHDNIMVTMGGDFTYQSAANWFMNVDRLINHVSTHQSNLSDINIIYSTPSCYLKAIYLYGKRDKTIHSEKFDFVPYGSDSSTYWTGFYTSRPSFKYLARRAHMFLQVVKQLSVISRTSDSYELHFLRHATNLILHHDAITGTSQQHVANYYVQILSEAIEACSKKASNILSHMTPTWGGGRRSKTNQQFVVCHLLNVSECMFTEIQESILLLVYNPSSTKTYQYIRIPVTAMHYSVRDSNDEEVEHQLVPLPLAVIKLPGRNSQAGQELCFEAENIPALGYTSYFITAIRDQLEENAFAKKSSQGIIESELEVIPQISNEYLKVTLNKETGLLESIQHVDGMKIELRQSFCYYSQQSQTLHSGAYSFRPTNNTPTPITERVTYSTVRGNLVKEIRQKFSDWANQVIRIYRGQEFLELEWVIGPIPVGTDMGKEVVSVFATNITNSGEFYTDSNSRQMMKRTCWNSSTNQPQKKPVSACYHPITSRICIQSLKSSVGLCVLTDRTQGGTSYNNGDIELMVHRRLLTDDGFGLDENLNEESFGGGHVVRGKHRIVFGDIRRVDGLTFSERSDQAARRWKWEPWLFFTPGEKISRRKWAHVRNKRFSALRLNSPPHNIHILTLEPWKTGSVLLRLENTLEETGLGKIGRKLNRSLLEDTSADVTVDLRKLFVQWEIKSAKETTLAANQWLEEARQMDWSTRYVYAGGDEGLPSNDEEYSDGNRRVRSQDDYMEKDSGERNPYSDEEPYNSRPKGRPKNKYSHTKSTPSYEYDRRKRNANFSSDVVLDFTRNSELNDQFVPQTNAVTESLKIEFGTETNAVTESKETEVQTKKSIFRNAKSATRKLQTYLAKTKLKDTKSVSSYDWTKDEDEVVSMEGGTGNLKLTPSGEQKHSSEHGSEIFYDDTEADITRSIYEMYYKYNKLRPMNKHLKPHIRNMADNSKYKEDRDLNESSEEHTHTKGRNFKRKKKGPSPVTALPFLKKSTVTVNYDHYNDDGIDEGNIRSKFRTKRNGDNYNPDEQQEDDGWKEMHKRNKRTTEKEKYSRHTEKSDTSEQLDDYVVTLRPTQIRTFIIYLVNRRRNNL